MTDTTNSVTDAPTSMIELVEMAEDAFRDVSSISGSALLAGERCPPGDKAALYQAACRVLQFVQIIRLDLPLHADSLDTLRAQLAEAQRDSERLDWLDKYCTGASDSERYLPRKVYWSGGTSRDVRVAIDAAKGESNGTR